MFAKLRRKLKHSHDKDTLYTHMNFCVNCSEADTQREVRNGRPYIARYWNLCPVGQKLLDIANLTGEV
jgi:hypothetical protein